MQDELFTSHHAALSLQIIVTTKTQLFDSKSQYLSHKLIFKFLKIPEISQVILKAPLSYMKALIFPNHVTIHSLFHKFLWIFKARWTPTSTSKLRLNSALLFLSAFVLNQLATIARSLESHGTFRSQLLFLEAALLVHLIFPVAAWLKFRV